MNGRRDPWHVFFSTLLTPWRNRHQSYRRPAAERKETRRVHIDASASGAEVKHDACCAQFGTTRDDLTSGHCHGVEQRVGRAEPAWVVDRHVQPAADLAGEDHDAGGGRGDGGARRSSVLPTTVAGGTDMRGRSKAVNNSSSHGFFEDLRTVLVGGDGRCKHDENDNSQEDAERGSGHDGTPGWLKVNLGEVGRNATRKLDFAVGGQ